MSKIPKTTGQWEATLKPVGFHRRNNGRMFRHNGVALVPQDRWLVATAKAGADEDALWDQLRRPGLWRRVNGDGRPRREFDLPVKLLQIEGDPIGEEDSPDDGPELIEPLAAWITATARGDLPAGWVGPDPAEVAEWLPAAGLTLEQDSLVRQGSLVCEPERLALRMPIVAEVPAELSPSRRRLLEEVVLDAQNRWRMVRIGMEGSRERPAIVAEVDISGAPRLVWEALFRAALGSLRWVTSWVVVSADLLSDVRVDCRLLEIGFRGCVDSEEAE